MVATGTCLEGAEKCAVHGKRNSLPPLFLAPETHRALESDAE